MAVIDIGLIAVVIDVEEQWPVTTHDFPCLNDDICGSGLCIVILFCYSYIVSCVTHVEQLSIFGLILWTGMIF